MAEKQRHSRPLGARLRRGLLIRLAILALVLLWLPLLHLPFRPRLTDYRVSDGLGTEARAILAANLQMWSDPSLREAELGRMRRSNAEWDFMGRTFLVLSLANAALREPAIEDQCLDVMDTILAETILLERQEGQTYFLMAYAQDMPYVQQPMRSIFVDGEIALMEAARCMLQSHDAFAQDLAARVALIQSRMSTSPTLCAESYPDECWMFCNSAAVAAIYMAEALGLAEPAGFPRQWLSHVTGQLQDPVSGLLVSSFTLDGEVCDGPEGSSIWFVAHMLALIDPEFAANQYHRAKLELMCSLLGFGYAREWPTSWQNVADIDSGPIVPLIGASAGSSGMALLGAATFDDTDTLVQLLTSLEFGAFPIRDGETLRYAASNQVGDSAMLYAWMQGPLWKRVRQLHAEGAQP